MTCEVGAGGDSGKPSHFQFIRLVMPSKRAAVGDDSPEEVAVVIVAYIVLVDEHDSESSAAPTTFRGGCRGVRLCIFGREVLVELLKGNISTIGERVK
jgi:hypothetical protein